uniref:Amine oxidase domain-containing protein n=1 Tax=Manihot esculenta TaxID=3983 RepID=A0A2C9WC01_MANES
MVEDGRNFIADAAIVTVPIGILKANLIQFEPNLPDWKVAAISDIGVGSENKVAIKFDEVFWPNVEFLGIVTPTSYACGYFLNLHKATGYPVLVYMAAGRFAYDLEKLSDESAANFVILLLRKMFPDATEPSGDVYERLCAPLGSLFFTGEAVSMDHQGSVYGAYSAGVMAAENCQRHALENLGHLEKLQLVPLRCELHEAAFPLQISKM